MTLAQSLAFGMAAMFLFGGLFGWSLRGLVDSGRRRRQDATAAPRPYTGQFGTKRDSSYSDDFEPGPTFMSGRRPPKKR